MKKLIQFFQPLIVILRKCLWFITRPKRYGAHVAIIHKNEVLIVMTTYWPGYGLPAGGIKKGETPHNAALREVREEVGIILKLITPLAPFVVYDDYVTDTVYGFYALVNSKDFVLDTLEIANAEWVSLDKLPELNSGAAHVIELYKRERHKRIQNKL